MGLTPYITVWVVISVVVLGLAIYRMTVASREDDTIHIFESETPLVAEQKKIFRKIETIDRWGQILTVVAVVYGLALAGAYLYGVWQQSAKIHIG